MNNSTVAATLIASAAGIGSWYFGAAAAIWPLHPQIASLLVTVVVSIAVKQLWPVGGQTKA